MDRQTTYHGKTALRYASSGKNRSIFAKVSVKIKVAKFFVAHSVEYNSEPRVYSASHKPAAMGGGGQ